MKDGRVEISEFYAARLDESEAAAGAYVPVADLTHRHLITGPAWREHNHAGGNAPHGHEGEAGTGFQVPLPTTCADPARVLRKVEAGWRILARYEDCLARQEDPDYPAGVARDQAREYEDFVLPNLAAEFSDRPDYQEDWKP